MATANPGTTVKVRMLTNIAGRPECVSGAILDLEPRIAKAWVDDGLALLVRDDVPAERATVKA